MNGDYNKASVIRYMMQHPENSKLIKEALSSPIGSTSRSKARKVFSIMNKLHSSNDGMGGPGMSGGIPMSYNQPQMSEEPRYTPKGMVIFSKIPTPNITYGKRVPTPNSFKSFNGSGGHGVYDGQGGIGDIWNSAKNTFNNAVNSFRNPTPSNFNTGSDPNQAYRPPSGGNSGFPKFEIGNMANYTPEWAPKTPNKDTTPSNFNPGVDANIRLAPNIMAGPSLLNPTPVTSGPYQTLGSVRENKIIPGLSVSDVPVWKPKSDGGLNIMGGEKKDKYKISVPEKSDYPVYKSAEPNNGLSGMFTGIVDSVKNRGTTTTTNAAPDPNQMDTEGYTNDVYNALPSNHPAKQNRVGMTKDPNISSVNIQLGSRLAVLNNNPGNLMFVGQAGATQGSPKYDNAGNVTGYFAKFATPESGKQALEAQIDLDKSRGMTVGEFINKYAPSSENNTAQYVQQATSDLGVSESALLSSVDTPSIAKFIAWKESNSTFDGSGKGYSGSLGNTSLAAAAQSAVNAGIGAGMFALANNPLETGKALRKTVWDRYNIDDSQKEINRMTAEGTLLPKDVTSYITARDEYLAQTDKQIDDYVNEMSTMSSDPATFQRANAHLNYLYTLRGRQNQTYIGFLNDAVDQHQAKLDSLTRYYNTNLAAAEQDIQTGEADYKVQAAALADMYTTVEQAPTLALQKQLLEAQVLTAQTQFVTDNLKKESQKSFIEQGNLLEGYIWNADHTVIPKIDLVEEVRRYKDDPNNVDVTENTITDVYLKGVQNYMYAPEDKDAQTGKGITAESKMEVAKDAVKQLTNLSDYYQDIGDSNSSIYAQTAATDSKRYLSDIVSSNIVRSGNVPKIMEAVKSIDRGSPWYTFGQGRRAPLTQDAFTKNLANATGNTLDESIARAIYAVFQFASNNGENSKAGVDAFFYPTKSTENWTNEAPYDTSAPFTEEQFAQNIANIYAAQYKP